MSDAGRPPMFARVRATVRGERDASALEALRRAGRAIHEELVLAEQHVDEPAPEHTPAEKPTPSVASHQVATWVGFVMQTVGEHLIDADYDAHPGTAGYLPKATFELAWRCLSAVRSCLVRAHQARVVAGYDLRRELRLPLQLPIWLPPTGHPHTHVAALLNACEPIRLRAEYGVFALEKHPPSEKAQERLTTLHRLLAEAGTSLEYAERLHGDIVDRALLDITTVNLHRALELWVLIGQMLAFPDLVDRAPAPQPAPLHWAPHPARRPGAASPPGAPGAASTPGAPIPPGVPIAPGIPDRSGTPGTLGTPDRSGTPGTPGTPGRSGTPSPPSPPIRPGTPVLPATGVMPARWQAPPPAPPVRPSGPPVTGTVYRAAPPPARPVPRVTPPMPRVPPPRPVGPIRVEELLRRLPRLPFDLRRPPPAAPPGCADATTWYRAYWLFADHSSTSPRFCKCGRLLPCAYLALAVIGLVTAYLCRPGEPWPEPLRALHRSVVTGAGLIDWHPQPT